MSSRCRRAWCTGMAQSPDTCSHISRSWRSRGRTTTTGWSRSTRRTTKRSRSHPRSSVCAMSREIVGKGLRFSLRHAPCAHTCRYCLISESRKRSALSFSRFEQLVHRFHDWRQSERPDLEIGAFVGPSFDYDLETLKGVARLRARRGAKFQILNLGGLRIRRGDELAAWLEERRAAGIVGLHASLAGYGETHD